MLFLTVLLPVFLFFFLTDTVSAAESVREENPGPFEIEALVGKKAPLFTLKTPEGRTVTIESYRGRVVLLNFWVTTCPPCTAELPSLDDLHRKLSNRGLQVVAVSLNHSVSSVRTFLKGKRYSFTVLSDPDLHVSKKLYKVFMVPITFLIDRQGFIAGKYFGEQNWMDAGKIREIEKLL